LTSIKEVLEPFSTEWQQIKAAEEVN